MVTIYPFPIKVKGEAVILHYGKDSASLAGLKSFIRRQAVIKHVAFGLIRKPTDNVALSNIPAKIIGIKDHAFLPEMKPRLAIDHAIVTVLHGNKNAIIE